MSTPSHPSSPEPPEPVEQTLTCSGCGAAFVFSVEEQVFYQQRGFQAPKRCKNCRQSAPNKPETASSGAFGKPPAAAGSTQRLPLLGAGLPANSSPFAGTVSIRYSFEKPTTAKPPTSVSPETKAKPASEPSQPQQPTVYGQEALNAIKAAQEQLQQEQQQKQLQKQPQQQPSQGASGQSQAPQKPPSETFSEAIQPPRSLEPSTPPVQQAQQAQPKSHQQQQQPVFKPVQKPCSCCGSLFTPADSEKYCRYCACFVVPSYKH